LQGIARLPDKSMFQMFHCSSPCTVTPGYSHVGTDLVPFIQHSIFANNFTAQTLISV